MGILSAHAQSFPPQYANALQRTQYDAFTGDVLGTGSVSLLLRARTPGLPSFLVTTSASSGAPMLLEELTAARIGYDLSAAGTSVALTDTNRDGRADLSIRLNGLIEAVLVADAQGMFSKPANDNDNIMLAWRSFCASLNRAT